MTLEHRPGPHRVGCNECGWETSEPTRDIAGCLASWHIFETHPDVWARLFGPEPPRDPDPRDSLIRAVLLAQGQLS